MHPSAHTPWGVDLFARGHALVDAGRGPGLARVWSVAAVVQAVGDSLQARFGQCVIQGELGSFVRAASGHGYFTLKDEHGNASLRCAIFRRALSQVDFAPREGQLVQARGVYEARGELQLIVDGLSRAGEGALYEQFLRLRARLAAEGLFDEARKRPINAHPRRVGLVTSAQGAALHDVVTAMQRRAPHVEVVLAPASVQGADAPPQLVDALAALQTLHRQGTRLDAILLCRGGGSLEDLWAFNDERVVRAVVACAVPVVCGVGHETDVTLADLAADLRAPTPTAAAELAATACADLQDELDHLARRLGQGAQQHLWRQAQRVDRAAMMLARPAQALSRQRQALSLAAHRLQAATTQLLRWPQRELDVHEQALGRALASRLSRERDSLARHDQHLRMLDPARVLQRGYAWLQTEQGQAITHATQAEVGQNLVAMLQDGQLALTVHGHKPGAQTAPPAAKLKRTRRKPVSNEGAPGEPGAD
jgi:exodeoxyribonuclease VII large subunit